MSAYKMDPQSPKDTTSSQAQKSHRSWFPPSPIDDERRLSMTLASRVLTCGFVAFIGGGVLGGYQGSQMASLRFRAENSHRFPTTTIGWYLYHKSKNYKCMLAAIKGGLKLGPRLAGWAGSFFFLEEAIDHLRGSRNCVSTVIAGLTMSGVFSIKSESCEPWTKVQRASDQIRRLQYTHYRTHRSGWLIWWPEFWFGSGCAGFGKRPTCDIRGRSTGQKPRVKHGCPTTEEVANR